MKTTIFLLCALFGAMPFGVTASADTTEVGSIKTLKGDAVVVRGDQELVAQLGMRLMTHDVIRTGKNASLGIVLRDDTTVSLGAKSELAMKEFTFEPDKGLFGMTLDMIKGTFVYVSGRISKLSPGSAKVETPAGVVAVRGTRFLVKIPA